MFILGIIVGLILAANLFLIISYVKYRSEK